MALRYVGGKFRQRRDFMPAILDDTPLRDRYLEPFVGGGSMLEVMAPHFKHVVACDIHIDLILMYKALQDGWLPEPELTEEDYQRYKAAVPSAERGFYGFACSFGAKWFGGYARAANGNNFAASGRRSISKLMPNIAHVSFKHGSYDRWQVGEGTVVYADPPYARSGVGFQSGDFDHRAF